MVAESSKSFERTESGEALKRRPSADGAAALAADHAGKEELVKERKLADKDLKEGKRRSGVTDQIGKLHITGLEGGGSAEAKGSKKARDNDPGFIPNRSEHSLGTDRGFIPNRSEHSRDTDRGFIPTDAENARNPVSDFTPRGPEGTRNAVADFTPGGSENARDIDPGFNPTGSEQVRDIDPGFNPQGSEQVHDTVPAFMPPVSDNGLKTADTPTAGQKDMPSLTPEQQKAAKETALELEARFFVPGTHLEDVRKALYGKTEAELAAIDAALKDVSGKGLEEKCKAEFQGDKLDQALAMIRHKDKDLVPIPEGLDRAALIKTAEAIHDKVGDKVGGWLAGPRILKDLLGEKPEEIKPMMALYKDMYGIELPAELKAKLSPGEFEQISKLLPHTTETKDHAQVEVVQGKVLATTAADGHGREFRYEGGQLAEVKSTFTGHTWKRSEVDGKEVWTNEKGTAWKGKFSVGADGNLTFEPRDGRTAFVFTPEGKTLRVPAETHATSASPADAKPAEKPAAATDAKAAEKPAAATDAKAAEKPQAADVSKEPAPLNSQQQAAAELAGMLLRTKFTVTVLNPGIEDVRECLYGKTEAQIQVADAYFKNHTGQSLEEAFKARFKGAELAQALDMLKHKDKDLLPLPEGVDRTKLLNANSLIVLAPDVNASNTTEDRPASYQPKIDPKSLHEIFEGKTPVELQAMNALFKDCHGITLEEYLQKNAFVPLGSLDKYAKEANDAKAAKENFESEVAKVDQAKIAEAAKIIHDSTGTLEKLALLKIPVWELPHLGDYPVQKAIQNFTPAEMEALKRHYKAAFGEDVKERVKDVPYFGESLQRTLDRPPYSAMDRIPVEKQAALREDTKKLFATMEYANGTDEKGYYKLLEGKTAAERAAMIEYYHELTGDSLERRTIDEFKEDAAELEKALNYLRMGPEAESANLHLAITENNPAHVIERLTTLTPAQLLQAEQDIQEQYGKSLKELIQTNDGMTQSAKDALLIFVDSASRQPDANGRRMTDDEWAKVMELSLTAKKVEQHWYGTTMQGPGDLGLFQNVMSAAPPDVRERFLNNGGEDKIEIAFLGDGDNIDDAKNYARFGKLSVERKIDKCDHIDDDEPGIRKSLDTMDQQERDSYLRGARIVKENILDKLPDEQKALVKAQLNGELGSLVLAQFDTSSLTAQELKDYEKFKSVNAAIDRPADDEEHWEWRDRAVYSGGVDKAKEFVEHLPWEKLQAIEASAEARENFFKENNFDLLSDHARKQIDDLLDKQKLAEKPEDLKYADGKSLKDVLKLDDPSYTLYGIGVNSAKEAQKIVEGLTQMPLADQQKYRQDSEYRQQVDGCVKRLLHGPQQEAALHMLESVWPGGGYPVGDFIDNINIEAGKNETSEPQVIRYVEEEFRKDRERVDQLQREGKPVEPPELRERLSNPKTAEDLALKDRLDRALHSGLDGDEYQTWAKPVLENGRLTFEQKIQLDKEKGNKEDVYKDVAALATANDAASIEERHRLAADANYRQQVLGHLPAEERELAEKIIKQSAIVPAEISNSLAHVKPEERKYILDKLNTDEAYRQQLLPGLSERDQRQAIRVLELGAVLPEDAARAYKIGAQPSTEEMMSTLRAMDKNSAQENDFKAAYADAFHKDIGDDLASKLEGKDKTEMERLLRDNPQTARELYFRTVEESESENRGAAAALTKVWGSQAGDLAEDSARQMYVKLTQAAESGKELSVDDKELQRLAKDATEYTDIFAEAKQASVDAVVGIALSVATIAVPGGLSLKLLYWTVGGGIGKVAMKAALLGDEYDGRVMKDFVSGAVDTACSAVGGAQIAKVLRLGSKVGAQATKDLLEAGVVKPLLKEGEQVLQKTLQRAVAEEIAHGSGKISDHAITDIVSKVAKEGATDAEKAILQESIKTSLTNAIKTEVREGARQFVHEAEQFALRKGLDAASGYVGGFAGGFSGALFEWDSSMSWHENLGQALDAGLQAGKGGLVGGAAFSTGFSVVGTVARHAGEGAGKVWHMIRGKDVPGPTHLSNPEEIASAGNFAVVRSKDAPHPSPKDRGIEVTPDAMKSLLPVGKTDYFIGQGGVVLKKVADLPNGGVKLVPDQGAALIARADVAAKLENRSAKVIGHSDKVIVDMDAPGVSAHGGPEAQAQPSKVVSSKDGAMASGEIGHPDKVIVDMDAPGVPAHGTRSAGPEAQAQPSNKAITSADGPVAAGEIGAGKTKTQSPGPSGELNAAGTAGQEPLDGRITSLQVGKNQVSVTNGKLSFGDKVTITAGNIGDVRVVAKDGNFRWDAQKNSFVPSDGMRGNENVSMNHSGPGESGPRSGGSDKKHDSGRTPDLDGTKRHVEPPPDDPALLAVGDTTRFDLRPAPRAGAEPRVRDGHPDSTHPARERGIRDNAGADGRPRAVADVSDSIPPLVKQVMDLADIPVGERGALLARINEIKLAKPEVLEDFRRRASEIMSGWKDASKLPDMAEASLDQLKAANRHFKDAVLAKIQSPDGSLDRDLVSLLDNPREAKRIFKDDPEIVGAADAFIDQRLVNAESQRVLHDTLKERVAEMQALLDRFAGEQGLPRVKVRSGDEGMLGTANAHHWNNDIVIKQELLLGTNDPAKLLEVTYHEFVHHEQTNLMIRGVVDDIEQQIGRKITADDLDRLRQLSDESKTRTLSAREASELRALESQFEEIRQLHLAKSGHTIRGREMEDVLRARGERRLTPEERARADRLYRDLKNKAALGPEYKQAGTDLEVTKSELEKLDHALGAKKLVERLQEDNGTLARHLFADGIVPEEVQALIRTHQKHVNGEIEGWPEHQAQFALKELLQKQKQTLMDYRSALYKEYISKEHEVEAFIIGLTLKTRVQEIGAPNHLDIHAEDTRVFRGIGGDNEGTGVFKGIGGDDEGTGVFKGADGDAEGTGVFKSAGHGKDTGRSNVPTASHDPPRWPDDDAAGDFADSPTTGSGPRERSSDGPIDQNELFGRNEGTVVVRRPKAGPGEHLAQEKAPQDSQGDRQVSGREVRDDSSPSPSTATSGDPSVSPDRAAEPPARTAEPSPPGSDDSLDRSQPLEGEPTNPGRHPKAGPGEPSAATSGDPPPKPRSEEQDDWADSPTTGSGSDEPLDLSKLYSGKDRWDEPTRGERPKAGIGVHSDGRPDSPSPSAATSGDPSVSPGRAAEPPARTAEPSPSSSDDSLDRSQPFESEPTRAERPKAGPGEPSAATSGDPSISPGRAAEPPDNSIPLDQLLADRPLAPTRQRVAPPRRELPPNHEPYTKEELAAIREFEGPEGGGHARTLTPEELERVRKWERDHFVVRDGDVVYARAFGGKEAPLGDPLHVDANDIGPGKKFQPIGHSHYYKDATTGDAYILQTNKETKALEMVRDPNVRQLDPDLVKDMRRDQYAVVKPHGDGDMRPSNATTGDAYLLQTNADGTLELVPDPRVNRLDPAPTGLDEIADAPTDVNPHDLGFVQPRDGRDIGPGQEFQPIGEGKPSDRDVVPIDLGDIHEPGPNVTPSDPDVVRIELDDIPDAHPTVDAGDRANWRRDRDGADPTAREAHADAPGPHPQDSHGQTREKTTEGREERPAALQELAGDGRVAGRDVKEEFKTPTEDELKQWRNELEQNMRAVPVDGGGNIYDKIDNSGLEEEQKVRVLNAMAEVRAHYKTLDPNLDGYQGMNWTHTLGEIDKVLDGAIRRKLNRGQIEDALLASMFSDSAKFPPGDRANFIVHNVDGAKAAAEVLGRKQYLGDDIARLEGIYRAVLEHQISPPDFMADMAANTMIGGKLRAMLELKPGEPFPSALPDNVIEKLGRSVHGDDAQKLAEFRKALKGRNPEEVMKSIQHKIQNPLDPRYGIIDPATGIATTDFTPAERALLETIGIKEWYRPNPDSPWYEVTRAVLDGDGHINYATLPGRGKLFEIREPGKEPWFKDATVFETLKSTRQSYEDAFRVMTPEGQELAQAEMRRTEEATDRVKQRMEDWFKSNEAIGLQRNADGTIPYWNAELKYPPRGPAPKYELQLDKLSDVERKQFEFAVTISQRMVKEMKAEQTAFMRGPGGSGGPGGAERKK